MRLAEAPFLSAATRFAPCSRAAFEAEKESGWKFAPNIFASENGQKRRDSQFTPLLMDTHTSSQLLATFTAFAHRAASALLCGYIPSYVHTP